jgi:hypothetical protein
LEALTTIQPFVSLLSFVPIVQNMANGQVTNMDIAATAQAVTDALAPFMPLLFRVGEHAAEEAGNRIGAAGWTSAKELWAQIWRRADHDPALERAARDVAAVPADPGAKQALRAALEQALAADTHLREAIAQLLSNKEWRVQQTNTAQELTIGVQAGSIANSTVKGIGKQERRRR